MFYKRVQTALGSGQNNYLRILNMLFQNFSEAPNSALFTFTLKFATPMWVVFLHSSVWCQLLTRVKGIMEDEMMLFFSEELQVAL